MFFASFFSSLSVFSLLPSAGFTVASNTIKYCKALPGEQELLAASERGGEHGFLVLGQCEIKPGWKAEEAYMRLRNWSWEAIRPCVLDLIIGVRTGCS